MTAGPEPVALTVESPETPPRYLAVLPTYNNAATLGGVIDAVRATGLPVLVVDDGSMDGTANLLASATAYAAGAPAAGPSISVVTHPDNRGKAAALRTGFAWAAAHGYTHAVTIDTDGQHDTADLPTLLALSERNPLAIVIGYRDTTLAGYPKINRLGRWSANTLVRWESGLNVRDSQCGLRVYPLATVKDLYVRTGRYGYETEVLTRAAWAGIPVVETPVQCVYDLPGGRVSHFRPWVDSWRATGLHLWLLAVRIGRWLNPGPAWRAARQDPAERGKLAFALAIGVFIANTPLIGLHTVLSVIAAKRLKLQPLAVVLGSHASTPPVGPLLFTAAVIVGHLVLHGHLVHASAFDPRKIGYLECLRRVAVEWTVGGLLCGIVLAALTYAITRLALRFTATGTHEAPTTAVVEPA